MSDINEFFRKNDEQKEKTDRSKQLCRPAFRIQISDGFVFINDMEEQKFNVGVSMIDVFDKFTHVVPIKSRKEGDVASGMIECLHKMGKKPKIVYTDDEGALNKEAIQKYLKDENIEHHKTRAKFSDLLFLFPFLVFYCFCLFFVWDLPMFCCCVWNFRRFQAVMFSNFGFTGVS